MKVKAKLIEAVNPPLGPLGGTVQAFIEVLRSRLIQYDQFLEKRGDRNIYRIGHWLKAFNKIDSKAKKLYKRDDAEAIEALKGIIKQSLFDSMPPVKNVHKQMKRWLEQGIYPSLTGRSKVKKDATAAKPKLDPYGNPLDMDEEDYNPTPEEEQRWNEEQNREERKMYEAAHKQAVKGTTDAAKHVARIIKGKIKKNVRIDDPAVYMHGYEGDPDIELVVVGKHESYQISVALLGYAVGSYGDDLNIHVGVYEGMPKRNNNIDRDSGEDDGKRIADWVEDVLETAFAYDPSEEV